MSECDRSGKQMPLAEPTPPPARVPIQSLLQGTKEVILVHDGQDYRLRITSRGKLILTK
jgi:hemin uptake protein HemP